MKNLAQEDHGASNAVFDRWFGAIFYVKCYRVVAINKRADMYEVGLFKEMVTKSGNDLFFTINIPQEAVVIPESIDAIRAALSLQTEGNEAVRATNKYLGME